MHINSPMNAESAFGLAIVLILLVRSTTEEEKFNPSQSSRAQSCLFTAALVVLVAAAFYRTIHFYFLSDDFILVRYADARRWDFRALFTVGGGDGFFRPVGYISLALTSLWASSDPTLWHGSALAWHIANSVLVFILSSKICSRRIAAFFAAALFAIHGSRPEAVAWIASVFDRVSALFVLSGLILFIHSFSKRKGKGICIPLSLTCMVLAILCKESAYIFPLVLLVFMLSKREFRFRQYGILVPYFAVAAILFAYRWILFGGIGGYHSLQTGGSGASMIGIIPALKVLLLRLWAVLFFPINWSIQPGFILAVLLCAGILSFCRIAAVRVRFKRMLFLLGFVLLSALPPLQLLLIGSDLQKSRLLYLPSVGFCLLLAVAAEKLPPVWRLVIPGMLILFNLAALEHNLDRWAYASARAKDACDAAAQCLGPETREVLVPGLPGSLEGVYFFANGFPECLEMRRKGVSLPIELTTDESACTAEEDCFRLFWDKSTDSLHCQ
jgi:hypothetical protein